MALETGISGYRDLDVFSDFQKMSIHFSSKKPSESESFEYAHFYESSSHQNILK